MRVCPLCQKMDPFRVLYAGLPLWLCRAHDCNAVWGFWSALFYLLPFNGVFFMCKPGEGYLQSLIAWLMSDPDDVNL